MDLLVKDGWVIILDNGGVNNHPKGTYWCCKERVGKAPDQLIVESGIPIGNDEMRSLTELEESYDDIRVNEVKVIAKYHF